jgi:hypothetical protein
MRRVVMSGFDSLCRSQRAALLALTVLAAACGGDSTTAPVTPPPAATLQKPPVVAPNAAGRGELVTFTAFPARITRLEATIALTAAGAIPAFTPRYDVQGYAVSYRTPGLDGQLTTATGAVYIPLGAPTALPVVAYMHGTVTNRLSVPSNPLVQEGQLFGTAFGSDGAVVVMPDYLGLGGNPGPQLYLHQQTHASAAIDLLRAARTLTDRLNVVTDRRNLFVTGYSQGGGVAMGVLRELEKNHATEFPVIGAAPMSGPYDLSGTVRTALLLNPPYPPAVGYAALIAGSMATVYQLPLSNLVVAGALPTTTAMLNGTVTDAQLATLPRTPRDLLVPAFLGKISLDTNDLFWQALKDNDTYDWVPKAPVRLYYGGADIDVPPQNALTAQGIMRARGATTVSAVNVGATLTHGTAVLPATIAAKRFLDSLRARPAVMASVGR